MGFEPTISAGELPKTYALDRAATGTGTITIITINNITISITTGITTHWHYIFTYFTSISVKYILWIKKGLTSKSRIITMFVIVDLRPKYHTYLYGYLCVYEPSPHKLSHAYLQRF